jgi:AcrR family transcriptional regulator
MTAGTIRKGRKFDQVLEGARHAFLSEGYERASMDEIARLAGVSKATLYSYFPDKRALFSEVLRRECDRQAEEAIERIDLTRPPAQVLRDVARQIVDFVLSDFGQRVFRICVAEADRFPELGQAFYESGPEMGRARLRGYLEAAAARGELVIEDFDLAADQFVELSKADLFQRAIFGVQTSFSEAEIARVTEGAVATFLARYGFAARD